jgi:rhomboid family GlyGly-CTERM serine protease
VSSSTPKPGRVPWLALAAAAGSLALSTEALGSPALFALTPNAVDGQALRLWTGHLVHFNAAHLRGDWLAFLIWAALLERESRWLLAAIVGVGAPLLSLAMLWLCPTLDQYRGLSALDCALPMALIVRGLAANRGARVRPRLERSLAAAALALFLAKCLYEVCSGRALLAPNLGDGVRLLPLAHLLGALLGALCASGALLWSRLRPGPVQRVIGATAFYPLVRE